jgi:hypothetical protein
MAKPAPDVKQFSAPAKKNSRERKPPAASDIGIFTEPRTKTYGAEFTDQLIGSYLYQDSAHGSGRQVTPAHSGTC